MEYIAFNEQDGKQRARHIIAPSFTERMLQRIIMDYKEDEMERRFLTPEEAEKLMTALGVFEETENPLEDEIDRLPFECDGCMDDLPFMTSPFAIDRVIFNEPATIVLWKDGTKTVVKAQDGDTFNKETGLAMCIAKKAYGNTGYFNEVFKQHISEYGKVDQTVYIEGEGGSVNEVIGTGQLRKLDPKEAEVVKAQLFRGGYKAQKESR